MVHLPPPSVLLDTFRYVPDIPLAERINGPTLTVYLQTGEINAIELIRIGATTVSVFLASLGPFLWLEQGNQLLERLFPFTRGLMHAYWAPKWVVIV
jgi:hypothetical protein